MTDRKQQSIALGCLALIILMVYSNTLASGFIYDDNFQIVDNPWIKSFGNLGKIFSNHSFGFTAQPQSITYRPAVFLLFMAEYAIFGLHASYWHLVNILIHSANTFLVFLIASSLFRKRELPLSKITLTWAPALSAAVFAVHPVNSETVSWIGCAPELVYSFFGLLSFYLYLLSRETFEDMTLSAVRVISVFLFFCALFAKETAVLIPIVIFAYERTFYPGEKAFSTAALKKIIPYIIVFAIYFVIRAKATGGVVSGNSNYAYLTGLQHVLNGFVLFVSYLNLLVLPAGDYPFKLLNPVLSISEPAAFLSVVLTVLFIPLIYRYRRSVDPVYLFAVLLLIIPIMPALYIKGVSRHAIADRYLYFSTAGLGLLIGVVYNELSSRLAKKQVVLSASFAVLIALYAVNASARNLDWRNNVTVWEASLRGNHDNFVAHYYLGIEYERKGDPYKAAYHLNESIHINQGAPNRHRDMERSSHMFLGSIYLKKNLLNEALAEYEKALQIQPTDFMAAFNAATIHSRAGRTQKALEMFGDLLKNAKTKDHLFHVYVKLAECSESEGNMKTALGYYEKALETLPENAEILKKISSLGRWK